MCGKGICNVLLRVFFSGAVQVAVCFVSSIIGPCRGHTLRPSCILLRFLSENVDDSKKALVILLPQLVSDNSANDGEQCIVGVGNRIFGSVIVAINCSGVRPVD